MKKFLSMFLIVLIILAGVGTGFYFGYDYKTESTATVDNNKDDNIINNDNNDDTLIDIDSIKLNLPEKFNSATTFNTYKLSDNKIALSASSGVNGLYSYDLSTHTCTEISDVGCNWKLVGELSNGDKYLSNTSSTDKVGLFIRYDYSEDDFIDLAEYKISSTCQIDDETLVLTSQSLDAGFGGFKFLNLTTNIITTPDIDNMTGFGYDDWFLVGDNTYLILSNFYNYKWAHIYDRTTNSLVEIDYDGTFSYSIKSFINISETKYLLVFNDALYVFDSSINTLTKVDTTYRAFSLGHKINSDNILISSTSSGLYCYTISTNTLTQITAFGRSYDLFEDNDDGTFTISSTSYGFSVDYDFVNNEIINYYYEI